MKTSAFDERVYEAVRSIPRGPVTTYGTIARAIGCGSARAVGQALKRNPHAPETPCHRVIAADRTLGGFMGGLATDTLQRKETLLAAEGVLFENGRLLDRSRLIDPNDAD
jgi:methylated-DNA-[protein]-cysteine S-methyltransferase